MTTSQGESMEAAPSADNGNIPVDAPNEPSAKPSEPNASAPAKPAEGAEGVLYELPDGRKVDAATLASEWKENFLPEFTRKSQELAGYKNKPKDSTITKPPADADPYNDPNYVPKTYREILDKAKTEAKEELKAEREREAEEAAQLETQVTEQVAGIKKTDPSLDENKLYEHAIKYGFRDLNVAYQNMKDMGVLVKNVQQTTAKNIQKRADPVSTTGGKPTGGKPDPRNFGNAKDFLRSLS